MGEYVGQILALNNVVPKETTNLIRRVPHGGTCGALDYSESLATKHNGRFAQKFIEILSQHSR
jgi:hypothetical protein